MASADPKIRQIKIKTGSVKRLAKEKEMYKKEAEREKEKMEKMKSEGRDEYEVKKQGEVHQESLMMIPDCRMRLKKAFAELETMLEVEKDLAESTEYQEAEKIMAEVKPNLDD